MDAQKKQLKYRDDINIRIEIPVQTDFDKYYIDREVHQVVKKVGEGEEDFIIVSKEVITKRDISQVVNADANNVGVEAYMKSLALTGDALPDVVLSDDVNDFTGFPETTGDMLAVGGNLSDLFSSLPQEITKGMSLEQFMNCDYMKLVTDYFNSLTASKEVSDVKEGD